MQCPLCNSKNLLEFKAFQDKAYFECNNCSLIFLHQKYRLSKEKETARYTFHQNSINDSGYVSFLSQIIDPALNYIDNNMIGLDFGCGQNPVLAQILKNKNINCKFYDPYFFPKIDKTQKYNFIFATECFEHFFHPHKEIETILSLLDSGGILSIMTEFYPAKEKFSDWYYIKDPTHVCFYNLDVFDFICEKFNFKRLFADAKRSIILRLK
jgi:hypothetical protein